MPGTNLQPHAGSDKSWVWSTVDFSEGEQKIEMFCLRFGTVESEERVPVCPCLPGHTFLWVLGRADMQDARSPRACAIRSPDQQMC